MCFHHLISHTSSNIRGQ